MLIVPLQRVPSQTVNVTLGGQSCTIAVRQATTGLFVTLSVDDAIVIAGVLALDRNVIVRDAWLGFTGDLAFFDVQAPPALDPDWTGLGTRFLLVWISPAELPPGLA